MEHIVEQLQILFPKTGNRLTIPIKDTAQVYVHEQLSELANQKGNVYEDDNIRIWVTAGIKP